MRLPSAPLVLPQGVFKGFREAFSGGESELPPNAETESARQAASYQRSLAWSVGVAAAYGKEAFVDTLELGAAVDGALGFRVKLAMGFGSLWFSPSAPHELLRVSGFGSPERDQQAFACVQAALARFAASDEREKDKFRVVAVAVNPGSPGALTRTVQRVAIEVRGNRERAR